MKVTKWPGYEEAGMTDKSAAKLFQEMENCAPPFHESNKVPMSYIVAVTVVYGGMFVAAAVASLYVLLN